jgi:CBS domain-containing protein
MAAPPPNLTSAFDPLTLADVLTAKATVANTGGKLDGGGPRSVVAVWETSTLREALDELAISGIKSVPVRVKLTGEILGFFDASVAVRVALDAVERGEGQTEAVALGKNVIDVIHPSLVSGTRGDGGSIPFACAALPLRELISDLGYLLFEQHCDNLYVNTEVRRVCVVETNQPSTDSPPKPLTAGRELFVRRHQSARRFAGRPHGKSQVGRNRRCRVTDGYRAVSSSRGERDGDSGF